MPGAGSYSLDSAKIRLGGISPANPPVSFGLYADSSGAPTGAAPLVTFPTPSLPAGDPGNDYTLTPATSFTLQPSTTYWFVADGTSADTAGTGYWLTWTGSSKIISSNGLASYGGYYASFSKWDSSFDFDPGTTFDITVSGTSQNGGATPEPATMTLAGLALGAMILRLRRR